MEFDLGFVEIIIETIMVITKPIHVATYPTIVLIESINEFKPFAHHGKIHYEKSCPLKPHDPTIKIQKKLIYNCYATIPWVLQLLCNYPLKNTMY
jgi:hypothetical protein